MTKRLLLASFLREVQREMGIQCRDGYGGWLIRRHQQ